MRDNLSIMQATQDCDDESPNTSEKNLPPAVPPKHPLEHKWTLWYFHNNRSRDWFANLHEVYTFDTVEDFWCLFNHIQPASQLSHGNDYSLFKTGIQPVWEDKKNKNGGRWLINVESRMRSKLNDLWLNVILFMIGESFDEYSDEIRGAYLNVRGKGDKISLWTADVNKHKAIEAIGKKLKYECLQLPQEMTLFYESHVDSQSKSGSAKSKSLMQI